MLAPARRSPGALESPPSGCNDAGRNWGFAGGWVIRALLHRSSRDRASRFVAAVALLLLVLSAAAVCGLAAPGPARAIFIYHTQGRDRSYKVELIDRLPSPPNLLIIGGSRSQRFDPVYAHRLTGLSAFNAAVQNCRPEDAFAFSSYLFSKQPTAKVHLMFALAATTFSDIDMAPGLLWDERLSQWFPNALIQNQQQKGGTPPWRDMPGRSRYTSRGMLTHNNYDVTLASGKTLISD